MVQTLSIRGTQLRKLSSSSIKFVGYELGFGVSREQKKGKHLHEGEKLASDGRVYRLKAISNNQKGIQ